ncbi:Pimeloyl-ACP methyl ester carboxylesterase [Nannocystis exedens]|uniref:Pimeloyl-ACP methyl ester carboxylesterase n=1 Tax=Nannocystis exedens TaxID=54 RepID=A0A1I2GS43_9BACT|nr:alpha/beta fold hydrolase [Nannocystis exedens]PCC68784.1 arylesterase [Nannocystis exedens]SFF20023.1 Pimeloyl-ACP methyl ester carboxylesterase [Nannocystis exedens]
MSSTFESLHLVDRYLAAWNERDDAHRAQLIAATFTADARYVDPLAASEGHAGIHAMIGAVQAKFPAHVFARRGAADRHGDYLRFSWSLAPASGAAIAGGTDFATLAPDGRFASVTGFLDVLPTRPRGSTIGLPDGESLFYRDTGGDGPPVVFVHGWALSSSMWQYQEHALRAAGLRCVAYDRRGHGRSSPAASGYALDTLADDLAAVLAHLDLRGATLIGHSLGCAEVLRYVARHGSSRVARIALLAPTTPVLRQLPDNPEGLPDAAFAALWATWAHDFPGWAADNEPPFFVPETSAAMRSWLVSELLRTHVDVAIATQRAVVFSDLRPDLAAIDRPTLILHGDRDVSAPLALGQRTAAGITGARLEIYPGAPHGLFVTHVDRVNHDLLAFIRG